MIPLEHDILSDFFLVPDSLVSSCYLGISASLEAERHHRRPQRLLLAWGKTTAGEHVVVWHLDHTRSSRGTSAVAADACGALRLPPPRPLHAGALYFPPRMFGLRALRSPSRSRATEAPRVRFPTAALLRAVATATGRAAPREPSDLWEESEGRRRGSGLV